MTTSTKEQFVSWTPANTDATYIGRVVFADEDGHTIDTSTGEMFIPTGDGDITKATKKAFVADQKKVKDFVKAAMAVIDKKAAPAKKKAAAPKKTTKGPSKIDIAVGIYTKAISEGKDRAYIIEQFMAQIGVSKSNAACYIYDVKRKMAKTAA